MKTDVSYMSGAGNLFTVIDNEKYRFSLSEGAALAPRLCHLNEVNSFATEGLILVSKSEDSEIDFSATFYNPDGTCDAMCGNGGRCAVRFALLHGISSQKNYRFTMANAIFRYSLNEDLISLYFPAPKAFRVNFYVQSDNVVYCGTYVDVGTRHFIVNFQDYFGTADFKSTDITASAKTIRYTKEFAPHGTNVDFYKILPDAVYLRTYERGVELETGACGTGVLSTAIALNSLNFVKFPVKVIPTSGIPLYVAKGETDEYLLTGPAEVLNVVSLQI